MFTIFCFSHISLLNCFIKPCESVYSKLYQTINDFLNCEILIDHLARKYDSSYNRMKHEFRQDYEGEDSDEDEDYPSQNAPKADNLDDLTNLAVSLRDVNPDEQEILEWKPAFNHKNYTVFEIFTKLKHYWWLFVFMFGLKF